MYNKFIKFVMIIFILFKHHMDEKLEIWKSTNLSLSLGWAYFVTKIDFGCDQ